MRLFGHGHRLTLLMCAAATFATAPSPPATAQQVLIVSGNDFSPPGLVEGEMAARGATVQADEGTIVVLEYRWSVGELTCVERIVVHDARHTVRGSDPNECAERGDGTELSVAMNGQAGVGHLVFAFIDDGKADTPLGAAEQAFRASLRELHERDAVEPDPPPEPPTRAATVRYIRAARNPRMCFHKKNGGWDNGNPIHLWSCSEGQRGWKTWVYEPSTGYIRNAERRDKCLHRKENNWSNGNPIHLWDCDAGSRAFKTWTYDDESGHILARSNEAKCMHKQMNDWNNGNRIHLWDCAAGAQRMKSWWLDPVSRRR